MASANNELGYDLDKVDSKKSALSGESSKEEANGDGAIN